MLFICYEKYKRGLTMPFICSEKRIFRLVVRFFRTKTPTALGFPEFLKREFIFSWHFFAFLAAIYKEYKEKIFGGKVLVVSSPLKKLCSPLRKVSSPLQKGLLSVQESLLTSQKCLLSSQESLLTPQKSLLSAQESLLTSRKCLLTAQKSLLSAQESLLTT